MIIELLTPDASAWDAATVPVRASYYAASLGAGGVALFHAGFAHRLLKEDARAVRRLAAGLAIAAILASWSRLARPIVLVLVASGITLAVLMVRRLDLLYATAYGWGLTVKILLVAVMLALAARHAFVLVPAAARGERGAGERLARSIRLEAGVALLVFWAAAEMVSIHPLDAGHRIPS